MKGLLLDVCCAPDALGALLALGGKHSPVVLYWGNSNIYPKEEWELRLLDARRLARARGLRLVVGDWRHDRWREWIKGTEATPEGGARCALCYRFRIMEAAKVAKGLGLEFLTTTLLVSPHKDRRLLNLLGEAEAARQGLKWVAGDMVAFFGESVRLSREMGMYRQSYCGCEFSRAPEAWGLARGAPPGSPAQGLLAKRLQMLLEEMGIETRWLQRRGPVWVPLAGSLEGFPLLPVPGTPTTRLRGRPERREGFYTIRDFKIYLSSFPPEGARTPGGAVPPEAEELLESGKKLRVRVEAGWREGMWFCLEAKGRLICPHDYYKIPEPKDLLGLLGV